jgi:phage N-6-adenine-methyltransferase
MGGTMSNDDLQTLVDSIPLPSGKRHTEKVQHSSKFPDWRTPSRLFAQLDQEFAFVLDAAADAKNKLCPHYFGPDHSLPALRDGLAVDWAQYISECYAGTYPPFPPRLAVFCNPPYSREAKMPIGPWIRKCCEEAQKGLTVVGVIPYSVQTDWWRRFVEGHAVTVLDTFPAAREVRKIPHRVTFLRPDGSIEGNAGGNTAIVVWKPACGLVAPWVPFSCYWDYEDFGLKEETDEREKA